MRTRKKLLSRLNTKKVTNKTVKRYLEEKKHAKAKIIAHAKNYGMGEENGNSEAKLQSQQDSV